LIIKSLSRKGRGFQASRGGGRSPFSALTRYMNRGIETEDGRAVLWHNFYGSDRTREDELIQEFEDNAKLLRERANGNVLYHEILSFSRGHNLREEDISRIVADIGQEYLNGRARDQLAYGVIHQDTDHIHLHLMISANQIGKSDRVRLSKKEFSEVQKKIERIALERYPELAQTKIYDRDRPLEKLKTEANEQAMKIRTKEPSRKESLKNKIHQLFERASSFEDLGRLSASEGLRFYQRGKTIGVVVTEKDGTERKHRLASLGVEEHYVATNTRLALSKGQSPGEPEKVKTEQKEPERESSQSVPPAFTAVEREVQEILAQTAKSMESPEPNAIDKEIEELVGKSQETRMPPESNADRESWSGAGDSQQSAPDRGDDR
jgi:Asp-tRNA(Asn)/Glu-tRNA(Gln) amidotransferase C subunit